MQTWWNKVVFIMAFRKHLDQYKNYEKKIKNFCTVNDDVHIRGSFQAASVYSSLHKHVLLCLYKKTVNYLKTTCDWLEYVSISFIKSKFNFYCVNFMKIRSLGTTRVYGLTNLKSIQSFVCFTVCINMIVVLFYNRGRQSCLDCVYVYNYLMQYKPIVCNVL